MIEDDADDFATIVAQIERPVFEAIDQLAGTFLVRPAELARRIAAAAPLNQTAGMPT